MDQPQRTEDDDGGAEDPAAASTAGGDLAGGDPARLLDSLTDRPIDEHPGIFAAVDEALTTELTAIDDLD